VGRQVQFVHFDRQKFRKSASMVLATSSSAQDLLTARSGLEPLLAALEPLSERIREYNERIEELAQQSYPQTALLKQIKGVGTLIALITRLTLEDPYRFGKSLDVGCYLGLQPGRRNSGRASRRCTSARKATRICERCWYRERGTCWDHSAWTAI
jgi:transposase